MTQTQWVLSALKRKQLTAMDALKGIGCFCLAERIRDLRKAGYKIETLKKQLPNGKTIAKYKLIRERK